jgi:hypothetical protein
MRHYQWLGMFFIFLSIDVAASLNNQFVYSQKLGTHIETVTSKTKGLRSSIKTPEGYTFIFGGYLNGAPKIFSRTLYVFKNDRLIFINLYADNPANKFGSPQERNKWTYNFYQALTDNLEKNYKSFFGPDAKSAAFCEDYIFYEKCNSSYYLQGKKKGIGIYINDSREVGLSYFDVKAVKEFTYNKFLREARKSLVMAQYSESSNKKAEKNEIGRPNIEDPNIAMTLKLE